MAAESTPAADDEPELMPVDAKYEFEYQGGATGDLEFDSKPDPKIEALRKAVKAKPVHYMRVKIDNRKGVDVTDVMGVSGFDADGNKYEYTGVGDALEEWNDSMETDSDGMTIDTELNNRFVDASNAQLYSVEVAEVGEKLLTFEGDLPMDGFTRVQVVPSGMEDDADAWVEGHKPANPYEALDHLQGKSIDECLDAYADIAEDNGQPREGVYAEPGLKDECETLTDPEYVGVEGQ